MFQSTTLVGHIWRIAILAAILVAVASPYLVRRGRLPWIVVDREKKRIFFPNGTRSYPFSAVIRLQLVSFARVGWDPTRLHYRGGPGRGELQMIIRERGKEETWCIVAHPNPIEVRKFAIAFHQATGVPVARAYPTTTGHWHVEPLDGGDANVRFESIHE
jgi:hypothetical protein